MTVSADKYKTLGLTARGRDVMAGRGDGLRMAAPVWVPSLSSWRRIRMLGGTAEGRSRFEDEG
jgi:hypothetical protein